MPLAHRSAVVSNIFQASSMFSSRATCRHAALLEDSQTRKGTTWGGVRLSVSIAIYSTTTWPTPSGPVKLPASPETPSSPARMSGPLATMRLVVRQLQGCPAPCRGCLPATRCGGRVGASKNNRSLRSRIQVLQRSEAANWALASLTPCRPGSTAARCSRFQKLLSATADAAGPAALPLPIARGRSEPAEPQTRPSPGSATNVDLTDLAADLRDRSP